MNSILVIAAASAIVCGAAPMKQDVVLYRHPERYSAFPSLYQSPNDGLWVSFGWNTTRSHYGRAAGGKTGGEALHSPDGGRTWRRRGVDKDYVDRPEGLGAFRLADGALLSIGPRMHEVLPMSKKEELEARGVAVKVWPAGHISASYRVLMRRKKPGAAKWESRYVDLPAFASMGGFGRGAVLADGTILKPVYGKQRRDDPATRAWVLRSNDNGDSWELITQAYDGVHAFNEAELVQLPDGRVLSMIRTFAGGAGPLYDRGFLWQTMSADQGKTWTKPIMTPIWGYPPHLLLTQKGDVLCTYGYRRLPYGVRACFSHDAGQTWDIEREVILRCDALPAGPGPGRGATGDLGYPRTVQLRDGTFFTAYYITLGDGVTHIAGTRWSRGYLGPSHLKRGPMAVPRPDPTLPPEHIVGEVGPMRLFYGLMQSFISTESQVKMVAIRISEESARPELVHTHGLRVAIRKPSDTSWWTQWLAFSRTLAPKDVKIGGWNAFVFDKPVPVTPGETYALTVYNNDYVGGGKTKLKDGLTGDHSWHVNSGRMQTGGYPNGSISAREETDLAFKVYAEKGELPKE